LQVQLEAQTPVPGLDADAVQDILLDKDNIEHDVRDVKIVHQAKSLRALKRSLQREKQLAVDAAKQCKLMETAKQQLEQEMDTLQLKLQRFQARAAAANHANAISLAVTPGDNNNQQTPDSPMPSSSDSGGDSGALRKLCEELKVKNVALQQELKKTQRALVREVGDDVAWDEVLANSNAASGASRRGRAQHIIMLKAKVKKLQAQLAAKSDSVATKPQEAGATLDVDQRAQQDLSSQHMHRQKLLDQLTTQRDELEERVHRVTRKYDALKARASILDREKQETRSKFQVLVEKSRTDDALVDALQRQLETWKAKLHEARRARTADGSGKGGSANQEERGELERLRKVVAAHKSGGGDRLMPQPSEISQYRAIAVRCLLCTATGASVGLKAQLEAKDKQLRAVQQPPGGPALATPALPAIGDDGASRIPVCLALSSGSRRLERVRSCLSTGNVAALGGPLPSAAVAMEQQQQQLKQEMETLRKTFRQSLREKDERIADLQQQQEHQSANGGSVDENAMSQELQDLQEENTFLRHEFDKLKARYEAVVRPPSGSGKKKPHGKAQ
ncbi:hypothetical protein BBJ28_00008562, partial [Nothophytophthora sp. Chile5]